MQKSKIISILIGILIVGGLGFFIFSRKVKTEPASLIVGPEPSSPLSYFTPASDDSGSGAESTDVSVAEQENSSAGSPAASSHTAHLVRSYYNPELGISFNYPEGFNISGFKEGEAGYTILAQKPNSKDSFQIFASDFDEPGPITPERINQDLPDMKIESPMAVLIGSDKKTNALIFFSKNESLGRTREVWFVKNGKLYQLTTYADKDSLVGPILDTLRF